jgi:hypothetical protein
MRASIEPVSGVPSKLLTDLLQRYGLPPEIIEWKYFDPAWSPRGERGYVWIRDGRAQGMIGLIPFRMSGPGGGISAAWTCDWYVDASEKNPGMGVLVFKEAIAKTGVLFTLGGNEATARIVPRLATQTTPQAAVEMTLSLTVGGTVTYGRVARRLPLLERLRLDRLPLHRGRAGLRERTVGLTGGIAREVAGLIEEGSMSGWAPAYDAAQLAWQFERCPAVEAASAFVPGEQGARAALIAWHPRGMSRQWRVALWPRPGCEDAAHMLLRETLAEIARRRGQSVSTIVAHRDTPVRGSFEGLGFRPTQKVLPLYALGNRSVPPITDVGRISHTDSDLGYRFG